MAAQINDLCFALRVREVPRCSLTEPRNSHCRARRILSGLRARAKDCARTGALAFSKNLLQTMAESE